jgi:hypothetical protein
MTTSAPVANVQATDSLLRLVLRLDAVACGAFGAGLLALNQVLDDVLGTTAALTIPVGVFYVLVAAELWFVASRPRIRHAAVRAVITVNVLWVVASVVAALALPLTTLGTVVVLLQAAAVAGAADLQYLGLRRARQG